MKTLILLLLPFLLICQPNQIEFLDYDEVLRSIKIEGKTSKYFDKLDYESLLLLDKDCLHELLKISPDFLLEKSIDTILLFSSVPDKAKSRIKTNESNICNFILSQKNQDDRFISLSEIYIKNKQIAVFTSFNSSKSSKYRLTMMKGFVEVEWIYDEIE